MKEQTSPGITQITRRMAQIRSQFPALARLHQSLPVAYFDGPGEHKFQRPSPTR